MKLYTLCVDTLKSPRIFESRIKEVSKSRAKKIRRYRFPKDRALSLGAGLLLNQALSEKGIDPHTLEPETDGNGKPFIPNCPNFHFNLSHSGDFVILGLGEHPIGVDIEQVRPITLDIARLYFFKSEYHYLETLPKTQRTLGFYRLWTLKESFMKTVGLGFKLPLDAFEVLMTNPISVRQQLSPYHYNFTEYGILPGYRISVCEQAFDTGRNKSS